MTVYEVLKFRIEANRKRSTDTFKKWLRKEMRTVMFRFKLGEIESSLGELETTAYLMKDAEQITRDEREILSGMIDGCIELIRSMEEDIELNNADTE